MFLMFPALLFAVIAGLLANTRICFYVLRICCQKVGECITNRQHLLYFTGAIRQFQITFLKGHEAMSYTALTFIQTVIGSIEPSLQHLYPAEFRDG